MADLAISAPVGAINTHTPTNQAPESNRHTSPDAVILAAFRRFQEGHALLSAIDPADRQVLGKELAPGEMDAWEIVDAADGEVQATAATTPAGIACKLWIAIVHSTSDSEEEAAAVRVDLDWFTEQGDKIDWNIRQILSAIRDLTPLALIGLRAGKEA